MFAYSRYHLCEPEGTQRHDNSITNHKHDGKPPRRSVFKDERPL